MGDKLYDINLRKKSVNEFSLLGLSAVAANLAGADLINVRFDIKDYIHKADHLQIDAFKDLYGERVKRLSLRIFDDEDDEEDDDLF